MILPAGESAGTATAGASITISHEQTYDGILLVYFSTPDSVTHDTVTFDGDSLTKVGEVTANSRTTSLWKLASAVAKTANVVCTPSGSVDMVAVCDGYSGVLAIGSATTDSGAGATSATLTIPSVNMGDLAVGCAAWSNDNSSLDYITLPGTMRKNQKLNATDDYDLQAAAQRGAGGNTAIVFNYGPPNSTNWLAIGTSLTAANAGLLYNNFQTAQFDDPLDTGTISAFETSRSNRLLLVAVLIDDPSGPASVSDVTFGGTSLTLIKTQTGSTQKQAELWAATADIAVGTEDIVVTLSEPGNDWVIIAVNLARSFQPAPYQNEVGATGNDTTPTDDVTSSEDELVIGAIITGGTPLYEDEVNQIPFDYDINDNTPALLTMERGAGTTTISATGPSTRWAMVAASFKSGVTGVSQIITTI